MKAKGARCGAARADPRPVGERLYDRTAHALRGTIKRTGRWWRGAL